MMRMIATGKQGRATSIKRMAPEVVKWISLLVILLAMTVNPFGEALPPPIARANPIQATVKPPCPLVSNGNPVPFNGNCYYIPTRGTCMNSYKLIPTTKVCAMPPQYTSNTNNIHHANGPCPLVSNGNPVPFNGICYYTPTSGTCMNGYKPIPVIMTCSEAVITPTTGIPSPSGNTGQRATAGQCPPGSPAGTLVSYDPKIQQCYYPLPNGATCPTGFNSQTVGPTTFCEIPPLTGIQSPSGTTGQPAINGQCPSGPTDATVDYDPKIQQCYYLLSPTSACLTSFNSQTVRAIMWCEAPPTTGILSPSGKTGQPATTGQCPAGLPNVFVDYDPKIQQCYYPLLPGTLCVPRYKPQTVYCLAPPITGIASPSGNTGQPVTAGQCPPGPPNVILDYDPQAQQCYYLLPAGATCQTGFNSQAVGPATYCEISPLTGIRSPSGNTGQPAPNGLCPAGPPNTSVDFDPKIQQCYYALPPGATCQAGYNPHIGFCQTLPLSPGGNPGQPATNGQCPLGPAGIIPDFDTKIQQCYYLLPPGSAPTCVAGYKPQTVAQVTFCQGLPLSPSGNPSLPAPDGLCPAGPTGITLSFDPKAQQCYYLLPTGATCQTGYTPQTVAQTPFCEGSPQSPAGNPGQPDTTGLCTVGPAGIIPSFDPKAQQCYYILTPGGATTCIAGYKPQTVAQTMYCQSLPLSPAGNPGLPAPDGLCPAGPTGVTLSFDPKAQQCYYLLPPGDATTCQAGYKPQVIAQITFCKSVPQSPSGNPGQPDTSGICPAGPAGIIPNFDPKAQQCYYLSGDGTCITGYSPQTVGQVTFCQGLPLSPSGIPAKAAPAGVCPAGPTGIPINLDPKTQQCYYLLPSGTATCQTGYTLQPPFCEGLPLSPAGNPSQPDTAGQCPKPPVGITANFDPKAPPNQQCFYSLPDGATTCADGYTLQNTFCEGGTKASTLSPAGNPTKPAADGQCPAGPSGVTAGFDSKAQQCSYPLADGANCLTGYTQQTVDNKNFCVSPPTGVTPTPGAGGSGPNGPTNNDNQCPNGGKVDGNTCTYTATGGKCDDGSKPDKNNKCTFDFKNTTCPANGSVDGNNVCTYPADSKGDCPSGGTASGTTCTFTLDLSKCPNGGKVDNNTCTYKDNSGKCLSGGTFNQDDKTCSFTLGSTNQPTDNQCPPVKGQKPTHDSTGNTCTYTAAAGVACVKPYTGDAGGTCTYTLPCPAVTGHTPTNQAGVCKYTPNAGERCAAGYGLVGGQCISNATTNSLNSDAPNVCPPKYKLNSFGQCSLPGSTGAAGTIDATCQTGYFSYQNSCVPNSNAYLIDPTTGPCTLNTITDLTNFPKPNYSCPYGSGGMVLNCAVAVAETCYIMKTFPGAASYVCSGFNTGTQIPANGCKYWRCDPTNCTWKYLADSTCNGGSANMIDCQIKACYIATHDPTKEYLNESCPTPLEASTIGISIHQSCTKMTPNTPLTCIYGNGTGTGTTPATATTATTKTIVLKVNCSTATPPKSITCDVLDPYDRQIEKKCHDPGQPNTPYTCDIYNKNGSTDLWKEKCQQVSGPLPSCQIFDQDGNNQLGTLACNASYSCTITDMSQHKMTIDCSHQVGNANPGYTCTSKTPDCPHTDPFPTATSPTVAVTEATITCDGSLVADLFMFDGTGNPSITITYPLSQSELEYELTKLLIGTQAWTQPVPVNYL